MLVSRLLGAEDQASTDVGEDVSGFPRRLSLETAADSEAS